MPPETDPNSPPKTEPKSEPETFSREYVTELRNENKGWRLKATEKEAEAKAAADAKSAAETAASEKISAAEKTANDRIVRAELKAHAIKAGMIDLDGLKLADLSSVKLDDKGEVVGAEALMESLKKSKPYLFGTQSSSTKAGDPPPPSSGGKKSALEMSDEEYRKSRRNIR